jgi:hypothetical protein
MLRLRHELCRRKNVDLARYQNYDLSNVYNIIRQHRFHSYIVISQVLRQDSAWPYWRALETGPDSHRNIPRATLNESLNFKTAIFVQSWALGSLVAIGLASPKIAHGKRHRGNNQHERPQ